MNNPAEPKAVWAGWLAVALYVGWVARGFVEAWLSGWWYAAARFVAVGAVVGLFLWALPACFRGAPGPMRVWPDREVRS